MDPSNTPPPPSGPPSRTRQRAPTITVDDVSTVQPKEDEGKLTPSNHSWFLLLERKPAANAFLLHSLAYDTTIAWNFTRC